MVLCFTLCIQKSQWHGLQVLNPRQLYIVLLNFHKNAISNDVRISRLIFDLKYVNVSLLLECIIAVHITHNYIVNVLGNWHAERTVHMLRLYYCPLWRLQSGNHWRCIFGCQRTPYTKRRQPCRRNSLHVTQTLVRHIVLQNQT